MNMFEKNKTIIGMIHLGKLSGQEGFQSGEKLLAKAITDIARYEKGGVNAVIIENWEDNTHGEFVSDKHKDFILTLCKKISQYSSIPVGINILPNDYKAAFEIANKANLDFIQLDVFVDNVETNYIYSTTPKFNIKVNLEELKKSRKANHCLEKPLLTSIKPKHYKMLDEKTIEESAKQAVEHGSDCLVVTGDFTGLSPDVEDLKKLHELKLDVPIIVGSGMDSKNFNVLLEYSSGAIIGTAFKDKKFLEVVPEKVNKLVHLIKTGFN